MHLDVSADKEIMIFPRFQQLDAVLKLMAHAKQNGAGHNYLIQHSAGSGKSHTISWTAHRMITLHDDQDEPIFNVCKLGGLNPSPSGEDFSMMGS
jgi:type I restriction enzyme R subunit